MPGLAPQQEIAVVPRILAALAHHRLAQRIVGARFVAKRLVVIEPRPGLDDRVDVERADLAAIAHDIERRRVDREVDAEALALARGQVLVERGAVVVTREPQLHEADAALIQEPPTGVVRIDDDEAVPVEIEVTLDERQGPFADRSEADHDDRACDAPVPGPMRHRVRSPSRTSDAKRLRGRLKPRLSRSVNSAGRAISVARLSRESTHLTHAIFPRKLGQLQERRPGIWPREARFKRG